MDKQRKRSGKFIFWCYCILMLWLLFGQRIGENGGGWNMVPFQTIRNYLRLAWVTSNAGLLRHAVINLVGNVVMFIPLGFFLPLNWQKFRRLWKLILSVILIVFCVEIFQLFARLGSLDVDDLILNVIGAVIGYGVWCICSKRTWT